MERSIVNIIGITIRIISPHWRIVEKTYLLSRQEIQLKCRQLSQIDKILSFHLSQMANPVTLFSNQINCKARLQFHGNQNG